MNATPVAVVVFGSVIVKLNIVCAPTAMVDAPNDSVITGPATTVMLAVPLFPVPTFAEVTCDVTSFFTPAVAPVTVTEKLHCEPFATVAPASAIELFDTVKVPPH